MRKTPLEVLFTRGLQCEARRWLLIVQRRDVHREVARLHPLNPYSATNRYAEPGGFKGFPLLDQVTPDCMDSDPAETTSRFGREVFKRDTILVHEIERLQHAEVAVE